MIKQPTRINCALFAHIMQKGANSKTCNKQKQETCLTPTFNNKQQKHGCCNDMLCYDIVNTIL